MKEREFNIFILPFCSKCTLGPYYYYFFNAMYSLPRLLLCVPSAIDEVLHKWRWVLPPQKYWLLAHISTICYFLHTNSLTTDQQSVNSRHAHIWRSFEYSCSNCGACHERTKAYYQWEFLPKTFGRDWFTWFTQCTWLWSWGQANQHEQTCKWPCFKGCCVRAWVSGKSSVQLLFLKARGVILYLLHLLAWIN